MAPRGTFRRVSTRRRSVAASVILAIAVVGTCIVRAALPAEAVTVPSPLPPGSPGSVIQTENLGPITGGTRYRILYHSRSVAGDDIAVSGLVFVPSSPAPPGGRPLLAWAHGTVGVADVCAPSLGGYDPEYLDDWMAAGYVVTATDYEGMGTPGRHPYLVGESEGRGVLDSIRAALSMPETSARNDVVIFGHSQGGHATIFTNELAPIYAPELHVLGAVPVAPASQLMAAWSIATSGPVVRSAVIMMGVGFAQSYPTLDLHDLYTDLAISRLGVVDTGCQDAVEAAYADLSEAQMIKASPVDVPSWKAAVGASEPGYRVGAGPLLIVQGTADEEVPYEATVSLSTRLCSTGQQHEFVTYPDQTHSGVFGPAHDTIVSWIADRFAGRPAGNLCTAAAPPAAPQPGECAPSGTVTPTGLDAISSPAVSDVNAEPMVVSSPVDVAAPQVIPPGGTITYTGRPSADLQAMATTVLEERVKPVIAAQYGQGLANSAWVTIALTDVTMHAPVPTGTIAEGTPVVDGANPVMSAQWANDGLVIDVPQIVLDSRQASSASTTVQWLVRDNGSAPPATISLYGGSVTFGLALSIGVKFFGADLVGGFVAPFSCTAATDPLAQTSVLAETVDAPTAATPATPVSATPALTG